MSTPASAVTTALPSPSDSSDARPARRRAPLVAAAMSARARAIDLTDLSDSDDSPVPVAGPSGPPGLAARRPGAPTVRPASRLSESAKEVSSGGAVLLLAARCCALLAPDTDWRIRDPPVAGYSGSRGWSEERRERGGRGGER
jgi:hypothetical protein